MSWNRRVVDVLDGTNLFGPGFEQVKGHLKILSDQPVVVFALFGDFDSQFLSAIEGQAPPIEMSSQGGEDASRFTDDSL